MQFPNLGLGYDRTLFKWLDTYTIPLEIRFKDKGYASRVFDLVVVNKCALIKRYKLVLKRPKFFQLKWSDTTSNILTFYHHDYQFDGIVILVLAIAKIHFNGKFQKNQYFFE